MLRETVRCYGAKSSHSTRVSVGTCAEHLSTCQIFIITIMKQVYHLTAGLDYKINITFSEFAWNFTVNGRNWPRKSLFLLNNLKGHRPMTLGSRVIFICSYLVYLSFYMCTLNKKRAHCTHTFCCLRSRCTIVLSDYFPFFFLPSSYLVLPHQPQFFKV